MSHARFGGRRQAFFEAQPPPNRTVGLLAAAGASAARALLAGRAGRLAATLTALRAVSSHRCCKAEAGNNGQHGAGFDQGIQCLHLVCLCCDGEGVFPLLQVIHRSAPNPPNFF